MVAGGSISYFEGLKKLISIFLRFPGIFPMANDRNKTKAQLITELEEIRQQQAVEKAAERIREEVLAMRTSDDLLKVVFSMFREIGKLGVPAVGCTFHFVDEEADRIRAYAVGDHSGRYGIPVLPQVLVDDETEDYSYGEWVVDGDIIGGVSEGSISSFLSLVSSVPADFVERWRAGKVWSHREVASETKYMKQTLEISPELKGFPFYQDGIVTHVSFPHGTVAIKEKEEDHSEEHVSVVQTLTEALSLGYLRFLDFQKVESQLMQASRERAEERLRTEVMAMRSSDDMLKVVALMWQELVQMGFSMNTCGIAFLDKAPDQLIYYWAAENWRKVGVSWTSPDLIEYNEDIVVCCDRIWGPYTFSFPLEEYLAGWKEGKVCFFEMTPEILAQTKSRYRKRLGLSGDLPGEMSEMNITGVPFTYGLVFIRSHRLSEEHIAIVQEFTEAISLGYLRFLDFQRLEQQNREIQENTRRMSDFLALMSHDLRTPMNAIIGYTRILLRRAKDALDDRQYRNLENIQTSSNHLLSLINDILDLSKVEAGRIDIKPEKVDMKQLATECIVSVESLVKPGVQLEQQLEDVNPVYTDADRLHRVVMNLLGNAIKFTEEGRIILSLRPVEGEVELSVADTGMGIPAEDLPHIFDEFRQVERQGGIQKEGTGLGLAIAKKSVEMLGGTITAESEVGKGTKFTLRIKDYQPE